MDNIIYMGDQLGFTKSTELGLNYKSFMYIDEILYKSIEGYLCIQKLYYSDEDWNNVRDEMMMKALRAKFHCNKDLQEFLANTGNYGLQYCDNDPYWGRRIDTGLGENKLGEFLLTLRAEMQN